MVKLNREYLLIKFITFFGIIYGISALIHIPSFLLASVMNILLLINFKKNNRKMLLVIYFLICYQIINLLFMVTEPMWNSSILLNNMKFFMRWLNLILIFYGINNLNIINKVRVEFIKKKTLLYNSLIILLLLQLLFMFLPVGYDYTWEGLYFKAYLYSPHVNSYYLIGVQVYLICLFYLHKNNIKRIVLFSCILFTTILNLMTGARTSAVIAVVLTVIILIRILARYKKILIMTLLGVLAIFLINEIIGFIDLSNIPLIKKTMDVSKSYSGVLNGRDVIWKALLDYYKFNYSIIEKIWGNGLGFSVEIFGLWGHNDLVETLIGAGIVGVCIYIYYLLVTVFQVRSLLFFVVLLILLFWNGLFQYTEFMNVLPILAIMCELLRKSLIKFDFKE